MSSKSAIHAALNKQAATAIDAPAAACASGGSLVAIPASGRLTSQTIIEIVGERERLLDGCKALRELVDKQVRITSTANAKISDLTRELAEARAATAKFATTELVADDTPALILAELRKHTALLEVLGKQGDGAALENSSAGECVRAVIADIAILRNEVTELRKQRNMDEISRLAITGRFAVRQFGAPP